MHSPEWTEAPLLSCLKRRAPSFVCLRPREGVQRRGGLEGGKEVQGRMRRVEDHERSEGERGESKRMKGGVQSV